MSFPLGKGELWAPVINMWLFRGYLGDFIPEILFNHKLSRILWQDPAFWFSSAVSYRIWLKGANLGELVYATIKTGMCVCENWGVLKREIIAVFKIVINFRFYTYCRLPYSFTAPCKHFSCFIFSFSIVSRFMSAGFDGFWHTMISLHLGRPWVRHEHEVQWLFCGDQCHDTLVCNSWVYLWLYCSSGQITFGRFWRAHVWCLFLTDIQ